MQKISRRKALKSMGLLASGLAVQPSIGSTIQQLSAPSDSIEDSAKTVTAITLGAGSRGNVYGGYALKNPAELKIVGVAEPNEIRNARYCKKHSIESIHSFKTWEDVFKVPKFADAVIISTPDHLHYAPCIAALKAGYDILLEKPMAPTESECREMVALAKKTGRIVAVCHVLRYAPYFMKLKSMLDEKAVGELISVQHMEPIEHIHMSHSFVRGNWHDSKKTTPIILAKSCHDLDILRWLTGKQSEAITAMGNLKWFTEKNAPAGSTARCTDGCAAEATCPYSALKIYHQRRTWLYVFDLPEEKEKQGDAILEYLKTTNYGRCVYRMENDQPDHYIVNIQFKDGVTANFSMEAFTPYGGRRTRIMGAMGFIEGDMDTFTHTDFRTGKVTKWDSKAQDVENYKSSGHGGGDYGLVHDWVRAIQKRDPNLLTTTFEVSLESHLMGFAAEKSRKSGKVEFIRI